MCVAAGTPVFRVGGVSNRRVGPALALGARIGGVGLRRGIRRVDLAPALGTRIGGVGLLRAAFGRNQRGISRRGAEFAEDEELVKKTRRNTFAMQRDSASGPRACAWDSDWWRTAARGDSVLFSVREFRPRWSGLSESIRDRPRPRRLRSTVAADRASASANGVRTTACGSPFSKTGSTATRTLERLLIWSNR